MPNASAKYILAAEDRTQSAVRSVRAGFESIDKSAKELTKGKVTPTARGHREPTAGSLHAAAGIFLGERHATSLCPRQ